MENTGSTRERKARALEPQWKTVYETDYSKLQVDKTGVYAPELTITQDVDDSDYALVYRFSLDRMKLQTSDDGRSVYLVSERYEPSWPHPLPRYEEWFVESLQQVADCVGSTREDLVKQLCSEDPRQRAAAYESIGSYHGFENFDAYPEKLQVEA